MTSSSGPNPDPDREPTPQASRQGRRLRTKLLQASAVLAGFILIGGTVGLWWMWRFVDQRLMPQIEENLSQTLERPLKLGELERISWRGVRVGQTILPPTHEDLSWARVEAIEIGLDLPALLLHRTLRPSITLINPNVSLTQGLDGEWLDISLPERQDSQGFIRIELEAIWIQNATLAAKTLMQSPNAVAARSAVLIEAVNGRAILHHDDEQRVSFEFNGELGDGDFQVLGEGRLDTQAVNLTIQSHDISISGANLILPSFLALKSGKLSSHLAVRLRPNETQFIAAQGVASIRNGALQVSQLSEPISDISSTLRFKDQQVILEDTGLLVGEIPIEIEGGLHWQEGYDLIVQAPSVGLARLQETMGFELPVQTDGDFRVDAQIGGAIDRPRIFGTVRNLQMVQIDRLDLETVFADFSLTPTMFALEELQIAPAVGGLLSGQGQINLASIENLSGRFTVKADLPGDAIATTYAVSPPNSIVLGSLIADAQIFGPLQDLQATLHWRLPEATYPGEGEVVYRDRTLLVQDTQFQVAAGTVVASAMAGLDQGNWQADLEAVQVPVNRFSPQIQGRLNADVQLAGNLNQLTSQAIQASGTVQIADAQIQVADSVPPLLERGAWDSQFRWTGDRLQIEIFTAPGIRADGFITPQFQATPPIGEIALNVEVDDFDLRPLAAFIPEPIQAQMHLVGLASFDGQITGALADLHVAGDAYLEGLGLNSFRFDSALAGDVQFALSEGGTVDLTGRQARLAISLDERFLPSFFEIQNQNFLAQGQTVNNRLEADIQNFPLIALDLKPAESQGLGAISGLLDTSFQADLTTLSDPSVWGTITITQPALGYIQADNFTANFSYREETTAITDGELQLGTGRYLLAGSITQSPELQFQGELNFAPGYIEDILTALRWFTFEDAQQGIVSPIDAGAAELQTTARGNPNISLLEQLEAFSEFMTQRQAAQQQQETALAPALEELTGQFTGAIRVAGSSLADITADFDIQGQNWAWGRYQQPNQFKLAGRYAEETLTLYPVQFESEAALFSFAGAGNFDQLDGQLKVENVPIDLIQNFVALPVEPGGFLSATAKLGGDLSNFKAQGQIAITEASLNQAPLQSVGVQFNYDDAHILFEGAVVVEGPGRLTIKGDIPYALPFMAMQPTNNLIDVEIEARNEGLALLNRVTQDQLRWEGGNGVVNIRVGGTLAQPAIAGTVTFQEDVLVSKSLASPLSDLTGTIRFNLDQVQVEQLQARLGEGDITIQGSIPIGTPLQAKRTGQKTALMVNLNQVPVNYDNILEAKIDGLIVVTGALLAPVIGGELEVRNGRIRANQLLGQINAASASEADKAVTNDKESPLDNIHLNDLIIRLEDRLAISGRPLYNVMTSGELRINGSLTDPRPEGTIRLDSGWINLFSNQFRLVGGEKNTATFTPEQGLDPFLDVRLSSRVQEVSQAKIPPASVFPTSEVTDTSFISSFGDVEIIIVDARVLGPASQLSENLELTSRPPRTQEQLVALIGGNVLSGLVDSSLVQFASFFGSGALASFSNDLSNVLGLRSLSIFPTTDTAEDSAASVGVGVEVSFDIGSNLGVSVLEILNSGNPPQVGLRYRFTDNLRLRGSTNLSGDDQVFLEYRLTF
ncbi:MAG: translocation/assembly module TamB domain-containing protein [Leptolyngbyaceae cyanobacterium MO_188.B28]|nr:translocation/assembly module TamB domain-containing protein [Leptolyngbyaceae cyanobacterium MO_188.B28]